MIKNKITNSNTVSFRLIFFIELPPVFVMVLNKIEYLKNLQQWGCRTGSPPTIQHILCVVFDQEHAG